MKRKAETLEAFQPKRACDLTRTDTGGLLNTFTEQRELLTCALCLELLDEPKTITCSHTFCEECIDKVVKGPSARYTGNGTKSISCPLCRADVSVPRAGFPTNTMIKELILKLNVAKVPKRADLLECVDCKRKMTKEELYVCTDAGHQQSSSTGSGSGTRLKLVVCCHCVLGSHRDHDTCQYLRSISVEERAGAVEGLKAVKTAAHSALSLATNLFREAMESAASTYLFDSLIAAVENAESTPLWTEIGAGLETAKQMSANIDKALANMQNKTFREQLATSVLESNEGDAVDIRGAGASRLTQPIKQEEVSDEDDRMLIANTPTPPPPPPPQLHPPTHFLADTDERSVWGLQPHIIHSLQHVQRAPSRDRDREIPRMRRVHGGFGNGGSGGFSSSTQISPIPFGFGSGGGSYGSGGGFGNGGGGGFGNGGGGGFGNGGGGGFGNGGFNNRGSGVSSNGSRSGALYTPSSPAYNSTRTTRYTLRQRPPTPSINHSGGRTRNLQSADERDQEGDTF